MKLLQILLIFQVFLLSDACLKTGHNEPPKCYVACKYLAVYENIKKYVQENSPIYDNANTDMITYANRRGFDCEGTMFCYDGYNMFLIDTDTAEKPGEYPAIPFGRHVSEAKCDPYKGTWLITKDGGEPRTFGQWSGVCVKNTKCPCPALSIDRDNAEEYLNDSYYYNVSVRPFYFYKPDVILSDDGCQISRTCPEGGKIVIFYDQIHNPDSDSGTSTCNPTRKYYWSNGNRDSQFFAPICVDQSRRWPQ